MFDSSVIDGEFNPTTGNWLLIAVVLGSAMVFIDGSGVNIALPVIQRELGVDTRAVQWVVEAYVLILAAFTLVGGALCDQYGRRRCYAIGMILFAAASLACAAAVDARQLIIARGLQGIGGALLVPGGLALIGGYFPPELRGRAIGTWAAFGAIGGMLAPLLAGVLVDLFSWRWIFYLNLPLALITLILLYIQVPESRDPARRGRPDWPGALLASSALGLLVFGLIEYPGLGISNKLVHYPLLAGTGLLVLFLWVESRTSSPMLPLTLFRSPLFSGVNLATLLLYTGLNGIFFFLPFYLIYVHGFSAIQAGVVFTPMSIAIFLLSRRAGSVATRRPKALLITGSCCVALAYGLLSRASVDGNIWPILLVSMVMIGIGMGLCIAPITNLAMGAVGSGQAGIASGVNNAVARLAAVLAIALFGILIAATYNRSLDQGLRQTDADPALASQLEIHFETERSKLAAAKPPAGLSAIQTRALSYLIKHSFGLGFSHACLLAMTLSLATALCCWLTIPAAEITAN